MNRTIRWKKCRIKYIIFQKFLYKIYSLEKLRKYLRRVNPTAPVFYVDTINYFGEGLIEKDKSEEVLIMEMDNRELYAYLQNENGLIDHWILTV